MEGIALPLPLSLALVSGRGATPGKAPKRLYGLICALDSEGDCC
jgi:hypothetical protein